MDNKKLLKKDAPNGIKILVGFAFAILVFSLFKENKGYQWLYNLAKSNLEIRKQNPDWTYEQKMQSKLLFNYQYLNFVVQNTPDTVMILFPERKALQGFQNLDWFFYSDTWKAYFLYPRKAISFDDPDYDSLKRTGQITHVAIIDKKGYDLLPYQVNVESAPAFHVFPMDRTKLSAE